MKRRNSVNPSIEVIFIGLTQDMIVVASCVILGILTFVTSVSVCYRVAIIVIVVPSAIITIVGKGERAESYSDEQEEYFPYYNMFSSSIHMQGS